MKAYIVLSVVGVSLILWGIIGGMIANQVGNTCDIGFWELCWTWHKNIVGVFVDVLR